MRRNPGRPAKEPTGDSATITLKVSADFKRLLMHQAGVYGMTLTEYLITMVERDAERNLEA
jgi:uncharacterized protein (DUF1778 family)